MSATIFFRLKTFTQNKKTKKTYKFINSLTFFLCIVLVSANLCSQNLITNGDFESGGNGTGFFENSSSYTELTTPFSGTTIPGNYGFTTNPQLINTADFIAGGDHTNGSGKMMVVDASTTAPRSFWQVGSLGGGICKGGLNPWLLGETYTFTYWLKSVSTIGTPASIRVFIGGVSDISPAIVPIIATTQWQKLTYTFKVTDPESCVSIELFSVNTNAVGNDFAVDDFSLIAPPVALSVSYASTSPLCPDSSNGTITAVGVGGSFPYSSYELTGAGISPITNTNGIFTGLSAGTYTLSIKDEGNNTAQKNNVILTNPNDIKVGPDVTICKGGSTNLSVSGSSAKYTWSASPEDPSLNSTNSSTPSVKPIVTTTYTVKTSPISDNTPNIVVNGDFESGNRDFITDYVYVIGGGEVQKGFGIVKSPKDRFQYFVDSNDHTTGTGYMYVADGSTFNSGNDKVWQQTIGVVPNQDYTFSYWVQTVALANLADMDVTINGTSVGRDFAPSTLGKWEQRKYIWNSGVNTTAIITIYDKITISYGNDFALDDIAFRINTLCSLSKNVIVTVTQPEEPTFDNIVTSYCTGSAIPALPTTSTNGKIGIWSPTIDNTNTTEYTFTPNSGQCTTTNPKITINVSTSITPQFSAVAPICSGEPLSDLPTKSLNNITGTWSPALNNTTTTKYTFAPNAGECGVATDLTIEVNPNITPTFDPIAPICFGDALSPLPTSSTNGITGTWFPDLNNALTTDYKFTPTSGLCATTKDLTITVNNPSVSITAGCIATNYTLEAIPSENNVTYSWFKDNVIVNNQSANKLVVKDLGSYKIVINSDGCNAEAIENVTILNCNTPIIPKGVSPNNDTLNDTFDLSNFNVSKLEIFNRFGIKVYSKSNYRNEWNGTSDDGQELPDATYYYVVEFESGQSKTGWVYLNRQN